MYELEKYYIEKFHSNIYGYNENAGGIGQLQHKQSQETIAKRVSKNTGQKRTEEQKDLMSRIATGKVKSATHRLNISLAQTGEKNHNYGKPPTEETRERLSDSQPNRKKIKCLNNGIIYGCIHGAAKALGICRPNISAHLAGRRPHVKGYKFEYVV